MQKSKLVVDGLAIAIETIGQADYISLTDLARQGGNQNKPADTITNWLRNSQTLRYLEAWEEVHNPKFKLVQMHEFQRLATMNFRAAISPKKFIDETGAIGLVSKSGNGGGTWAHSDIALEFCTWLDPRFKVFFIKEFQRLKRDELERRSLEWHVERVTDLLDEARNWMDSMPGQKKERNRLAEKSDEGKI